MTSIAAGIHDHPGYKLGLSPPKNAPALDAARFLTGNTPKHPVSADHFGQITFGLDTNDKFGVCGPTSVDNLIRLVSTALAGATTQATLAGVYDLYRRSGNTNFDPATGADDNGVDMQTMLEALLSGGIHCTGAGAAMGDRSGLRAEQIVTPVAFAKVAPQDDLIEACIAIFGGVLWGVNLLVPQQAQSDAKPPEWKYKKGPEWGGHAVLAGAYEKTLIDVISWQMRIKDTSGFRSHQLQEVWLVIFPWHLSNPAFQAGVDLSVLKADYQDLTGKPLVVPGS